MRYNHTTHEGARFNGAPLEQLTLMWKDKSQTCLFSCLFRLKGNSDLNLMVKCHFWRLTRTRYLLILCFLLEALLQTQRLVYSGLFSTSMGQIHQSQNTSGKSSTSTRLIQSKSEKKTWGCQRERVAPSVTTGCFNFFSWSHKFSQQNLHTNLSLSPKGESH